MTCDSCCREFHAVGHGMDCPYCGYNNGRGWWPRSDDPVGVAAAKAEEKQFKKELRRQKRRDARLGEALAHA